ncbi:MAG: hypothetical protein JKY81_04750 [Colwellia sp.]|nr:hypothetical protein [Colwellia sp.]
MSNDAEYLKKVIRENLLIELKQDDDKGDKYIIASLSFKGDKKPFAVHVVEI